MSLDSYQQRQSSHENIQGNKQNKTVEQKETTDKLFDWQRVLELSQVGDDITFRFDGYLGKGNRKRDIGILYYDEASRTEKVIYIGEYHKGTLTYYSSEQYKAGQRYQPYEPLQPYTLDADGKERRLATKVISWLQNNYAVNKDTFVSDFNTLNKQLETVFEYGIDQELGMDVLYTIDSYPHAGGSWFDGRVINGVVRCDLEPGQTIEIDGQAFSNNTEKNYFMKLPFTASGRTEGNYYVAGEVVYAGDVEFSAEGKKIITLTSIPSLDAGSFELVGRGVYLTQGEYMYDGEPLSSLKRPDGRNVFVGDVLTVTLDDSNQLEIETTQGTYQRTSYGKDAEFPDEAILPMQLPSWVADLGTYQSIAWGITMLYQESFYDQITENIGTTYKTGLLLDNVFSNMVKKDLMKLHTFYGSDLYSSEEIAVIDNLSNLELSQIMSYTNFTGQYGSPEYFHENAVLQTTSFEEDQRNYTKQLEVFEELYDAIQNFDGEIPETYFEYRGKKVTGRIITEQWLKEDVGYDVSILHDHLGDDPIKFIRVPQIDETVSSLGMVFGRGYDGILYTSDMPFVIESNIEHDDKRLGFASVLLQEMQHARFAADEPGSEIPNLLIHDPDHCFLRVYETLSELWKSPKVKRSVSDGYVTMYALYEKALQNLLGEEYQSYVDLVQKTYEGDKIYDVTFDVQKNILSNLINEGFMNNLAREYYRLYQEKNN